MENIFFRERNFFSSLVHALDWMIGNFKCECISRALPFLFKKGAFKLPNAEGSELVCLCKPGKMKYFFQTTKQAWGSCKNVTASK